MKVKDQEETSIGRLLKWLVAILKKGIWFIGLVPQLLDLIFAYIPSRHIPSSLLNLIEAGGNWTLTIVLASIGLMISSYCVYGKELEASRAIQVRMALLEDSRPDIEVGFRDLQGNLSNRIEFQLEPLPERPDIDELVAKKKERLLSRSPTSPFAKDLASMVLMAMGDPNPNYGEALDEYMSDFRKYKIAEYEIGLDRCLEIGPMLSNQGPKSATDIVLQLQMPQEYEPLEEHQLATCEELNEDFRELELYVQKPIPPSPTISRLEAPLINAASLMTPFQPDIRPPDIPSNGPFYNLRDGTWNVGYKLNSIAPCLVGDEFDPFPIWVGEVTQSSSWTVIAKVYCSELSTPITSELQIDLIVGNNSQKV